LNPDIEKLRLILWAIRDVTGITSNAEFAILAHTLLVDSRQLSSQELDDLVQSQFSDWYPSGRGFNEAELVDRIRKVTGEWSAQITLPSAQSTIGGFAMMLPWPPPTLPF
jgi:hypothetical protein